MHSIDLLAPYRRWRARRTYRSLCRAMAYSLARRQRMDWWKERTGGQ